ncbi:Arylsulfatase [Pontiella desulfatans]|uniref:Arylsulfatase n=1 Tax=Pontiella desulfatans TaxID=2750659 RepID=A0A6C2U1W1_PONDE|nr:sulfatase [Pontiella desulfatans]SPS73897.1 sulfatase S1_14 [Kiritimatiellales bacterium]VGO13970.1 Arylsulfatase [Pontiella desulfatans]
MNVAISRCLGLILFYVCFLSLATPSAIAKQPNVLFIFVDDQGYYDLGCYGATEVETPRIDALAAKGLRFTDHYSAAPICSPSRAGLLTGCYPRRSGNHIWVHRPDSEHGIPSDRLTLGELFKTAGYATCCIGKWHVGFQEQFLPKSKGFDHYYGVLHNLDSCEVGQFEAEGGMPLLRNDTVLRRNTPPGELVKLYTEEAIRWIGAQVDNNRPFFLYLPHTMLHEPLGVTDAFKGSSDWGLYGDAVQEMDFYTGKLVDALEQFGVADNTLVIYTSDNGRLGGRTPQQPIRGTKLTTYEGGLRVPCVVYGPGLRIPEGEVTSALTWSMDWFPTLASLAGIKVPDDAILDGRDLSALLTAETDEIPAFDEAVSLNAAVPLRRPYQLDSEWQGLFTQEEYLNAFFYHGSEGMLSAVRAGKWKLALTPALRLYDLEADPGERVEVIARWPSDELLASTAPEDIAKVEAWKVKAKLRGMAVRFQQEMEAVE